MFFHTNHQPNTKSIKSKSTIDLYKIRKINSSFTDVVDDLLQVFLFQNKLTFIGQPL